MGRNYKKTRTSFKGFGEPSPEELARQAYATVMRLTKERVQAQLSLGRAIEAATDYQFVDCGQLVNSDGTPACDYRDLVMESRSGHEIQFRIFDGWKVEWDGVLPLPVKYVVERWVEEGAA